MIRQRLQDRPVMVRETIRKTAKLRDGELDDLLARFDALATPWTPPERYCDLLPQTSAAAGASIGY
jgi:hypothetical protein